jgi:hypothetical protein
LKFRWMEMAKTTVALYGEKKKGSGKSNRNRRSPSGMTTKKQQQRQE